jgi:hypothetical protein
LFGWFGWPGWCDLMVWFSFFFGCCHIWVAGIFGLVF